MKKIFVVSALFIISIQSLCQIKYNVTVYDQLDKYTGGALGTDYSEIWGYTDTVKNREYAIIGTSKGTSIVDITTLPIKEVSYHYGPPSSYHYHEFRTYKNYLYIGAEGSDTSKRAGIQIIDLITLPDSGTFKKVFVWIDTNSTTKTTTNYYRAHTVSIEKNFLYVNGGDFGGTRIMDISNPLNPLQVGSYGKGSTPYIHDSYIVNDTLYAAAINKGTFDIVNFKDKGYYTQTSNKVVSSTSTPERRVHNIWKTENGNYVLTTDETAGGHLRIFDIRNRTAPIQVAEWSSNSNASIHNVFVKGDFAYIAYYTEGLRILDIKNPANPIEVGFYDTFTEPVVPVYAGAWGVFPFFPSGKIAVSDMQKGVLVFNVNKKYGGKVTLAAHDALNQPIDSADVTVVEMGRIYRTNAKGECTYGSAEGDHTIKISKKGFVEKNITVTTIAGIITPVSTTLQNYLTLVENQSAVPSQIVLGQNYPNPFNPSTIIEYSVGTSEKTFQNNGHGFSSVPTDVSLKVYDAIGREVATLINEKQSEGAHSVNFNAHSLTAGAYYYRLIVGNISTTHKMIIAK